MLLDDYSQPRADPVTHQGQEVFEYIEQVVAARYRAHELNDHEDETPDPTGDGFGITTQDLAAQTRGVRGRCVIRDATESEEHGAETSKGAEAVVAGQEERTGRGGIGVGPAGGGGHAGSNSDSDQVHKHQSGPQASPGREEGEPFARVRGIIDVKVGSDGGEADGDGELEGEEGAAIGRDRAGRTNRLQRGVEIVAGGADEHE